MKKFYWFSYTWSDGRYTDDTVTTEHPFNVIYDYTNLEGNEDSQLLNWKEISEEEFNLFRKLYPS